MSDGEILPEQFLGPVAEDFLMVGADVGVNPVLRHLADQVERVFGDEPVALLAALGLVARLAQGVVVGGERAVFAGAAVRVPRAVRRG